ncbi:type IV secretory system conjugative DNA transfer family protein [Xanthomonas campestris]|uniref:type IV secretory system conjugative DNA transfer family protein n=1 Tax=Xanthomonas campestris TaxID=339 RepID=UPI002379F69D|nr:type IV secretory system conjugative DNA transfer family protein [Xanthomonas campestris]WDK04509.1 type IV secretory system conjugative DNA transfer family protein [Xanthomonas campestris]
MNAAKWAKLVFVLVVLAIGTAGVIWLGGFLFFALAKVDPIGKTDIGTWWLYWSYYKTDPSVSKRLLIAIAIPAVVIYGAILAATVAAMRDQRKLYGESRFANQGEIARAGLFAPKGIIVGKWKNRFLLFPGLQFVLLSAPTRSGKGVGIVIPNLLSWEDSVVVLDVKQENYQVTSGWRARYGHACYLFNPFAEDGRTHRYNPLGYISDNPRLRVTDILDIGYAIWSGEGKDAHWDDTARNLFLGLTLYLCETPELPCTFGELLRQASGKGKSSKDHIQGVITARNYREFGDIMLNAVGEDEAKTVAAVMKIKGVDKDEAEALCADIPFAIAEDVPAADIEAIEQALDDCGAEYETERRLDPIVNWDGVGLPPLSMECVDALNRFVTTSDNTLSSIMSTFNSPLTLWASPIFDAATSANDFDLRQVRRKKMSVYIGIPAGKLDSARLIMNLLFSQLVKLNLDVLLNAEPDVKYQCMMLMDEFTAPGRIGVIDKSNAYMAGYGLRLVTIIQSTGQLQADIPLGYGREKARTLATNHACQIFYTPREQQDANDYSESLGYYTFKSTGRSRQLGRAGGSESESDQKRPLMMPQELKEMSQREQIINLENTKAIKCTKIRYYDDWVFLDRLAEVDPTLRKKTIFGTRRKPKQRELEASWGAWRLAAPVPLIDFDLHDAVVQVRMREVTPDDLAAGIDLRKLALDTTKIRELAAGQELPAEQVTAIVDDFFSSLEANSPPADGEPGDEDAVSDEELARLDAEAAAESASDDEQSDIQPAASATVASAPSPTLTATPPSPIPPIVVKRSDVSEVPAAEAPGPDNHKPASHDEPEEIEVPDLDDMATMYDDIPDFDDYVPDGDVSHPDDEELVEDDEPVAAQSSDQKPILDLSILDRPIGQK